MTVSAPSHAPATNVIGFLAKWAAILGIPLFALMLFFNGTGGNSSNSQPPQNGTSCVTAAAVDMAPFVISNLVAGPGGAPIAFTIQEGNATATFVLENIDAAYTTIVQNATGASVKMAWGAEVNNFGLKKAGSATRLLRAGDSYIANNSTTSWRLFKNHSDLSWGGYRSCYTNIDIAATTTGWENIPSWLFRVK
jgi:hypothetical protein